MPAKLRPRDIEDALLVTIFEKPSTRTRVSFDVAMRQLGGQTISLNNTDLQLGRGESIADTARVLSRYVDAIMIRANAHATLLELAALRHDPRDQRADRPEPPVPGHGRHHDLRGAQGADQGPHGRLGRRRQQRRRLVDARGRALRLRAARSPAPTSCGPSRPSIDWVKREKGAVRSAATPAKAVRGADCVVTDTWVSMGQTDAPRRKQMLEPYGVDAKLMSQARQDAIFMHCLPAYRGHEVTADVIDGPQSVVFDEAENRLHAQKAILAWCLGVQ